MVMPDSIFAPKFTFTPSSGVLGVGQSHSIHIEFQSDILGEFNEEFQWELEVRFILKILYSFVLGRIESVDAHVPRSCRWSDISF
jgi:hypothetical protein